MTSMKKFIVILLESLGNGLKRFIYKHLNISISNESWYGIIQFLKFGIVGVSNTVIGYLIYAITLKVLRFFEIAPAVDIYIAQFVMFMLSVAWSFYWNNSVVFTQADGEHRNWIAALFKTYASYAFTSLFLSEFLLHLWVNVIGVDEYIAPIINLMITVPLNFVIQKYWAFRREE